MESDTTSRASKCKSSFYQYLQPFSYINWPRSVLHRHSALGAPLLETPSAAAFESSETVRSTSMEESVYPHNTSLCPSSDTISTLPEYSASFSNSNVIHFNDEFRTSKMHTKIEGRDASKSSSSCAKILTNEIYCNKKVDDGDIYLKKSFDNERGLEGNYGCTEDIPIHAYDDKLNMNKERNFTIPKHNKDKSERTFIDNTGLRDYGHFTRSLMKKRDRRNKAVDQSTTFRNNNILFENCEKAKRKEPSLDKSRSGNDCLLDTSLKFQISEEEAKQLTQTKSGITATLLNSPLWRAFHEVGTEMIINRGGRRMFPYLSVSVKGLEPDSRYDVSLQIIPASTRRFKYINMKWIPVGLADMEAIQMPYTHQDSPNTGSYWNNSKITFCKIKLTNNLNSAAQNILLQSMHKYRIVTTFIRLEDGQLEKRVAKTSVSFTFPETDFTAVTAYQNEAVTQMKIHNNPFAKAFRDANFSSIRRNIAFRKRKRSHCIAEPPKATHGTTMSSICDAKPGTGPGELMTPLYSPHLPTYAVNSRSFGGAGFQLTQTPSLQGLGIIAYCLPFGGFPVIPPNLCSRLLPVPASRFGTNYVTGKDLLTAENPFLAREASSHIPRHEQNLETSTSTMDGTTGMITTIN